METAIRLTLGIHVLAGATLVGTPLIAIWITYYKRRFDAPKSSAAAPAA